jgi:hypothetical protein
MRAEVRCTVLVAGILAAGALAACGTRSGILGGDPAFDAPAVDGGRFVQQRDGGGTDAAVDALPPIDAAPPPDAPRMDCADAGTTLVYAVTESDTLLAFDPATGAFGVRGRLACPDPRHPFSMAVDHAGMAYVLYADAEGGGGAPGRLFRVSTATGACAETSFSAPDDRGFDTFGMGFVADSQGGGETLFVASDRPAGGTLARLELPGLAVRAIAPFAPTFARGELTGTGDGRLFAFYSKAAGGSAVALVEAATARVVAETPIPGVDQGTAWAFAFWAGDFYLFTSPGARARSIVSRFRPADGSIVDVASYPERITGAGVSTCAPAR